MVLGPNSGEKDLGLVTLTEFEQVRLVGNGIVKRKDNRISKINSQHGIIGF